MGVWEGMFDYCGCGHLVRIFVIGTIARRKVNVRSQFAAGIMFRSAAYLVFISLNHECLHLRPCLDETQKIFAMESC